MQVFLEGKRWLYLWKIAFRMAANPETKTLGTPCGEDSHNLESKWEMTRITKVKTWRYFGV